MIKFGVSPIAWSNDDMHELGGETSLATCLQDVSDLGFDGVELGNKFPRTPDQLCAVLDGYGIELVGGWFSGNLLENDPEDELARMEDHLALLRAAGTDVFIYAEVCRAIHGNRSTPMHETPRLSQDEWATFASKLNHVADALGAQGFRLAYHHHMGTVVETGDDLDRFLALTQANVGLVLDVGHATLGGIDPVRIITQFPERIIHVHCKDIRPAIAQDVRASGKSFLDGVVAGMFTVPGDGNVDFAPVFDALAAIAYSGWIVVEAEQDPAMADPRTYAAIGLSTLQSQAARVGLGHASAGGR